MSRYQNRILEIVNQTQAHLSAEEIFFLLRESCPSVVMATVYNNLNALSQAGKIRRIAVEGKVDRYDKPMPHDHLVCTICQKLTDIQLPDLTERLTEAVGSPIESYDLKIRWICPECREKMQS